ncbi:MAG: putative nuclease of restriction endonuclease-like (RecB) superfamily, partial [Planctomycetota bacterium]
GHNIRLIQKVKDREQREWYIRACIANGWSRNVFEMQIESGLYARRGTSNSNFERTLTPEHSDLVQQTIKDPYNFEFLGIAEEVSERVLEKGLVAHDSE